jgi:hypothetical protein
MTLVAAAGSRARTVPIGLCALLALLVITVAADTTSSRLGYGVVAGSLAIGLLVAAPVWLRRRSGKIALILALGSLVAAVAVGADLPRVAASAARLSDALVLLLCVGLMRPGLAALQLDRAIAAQIARVPPRLRPAALVLGSACGALGGSFGAVATVGAALGDRATPPAVAARASMRGLVLSMLLGPSVASVAVVLALFPDVSWGRSLALGLPLAALGALFACVGQPRLSLPTSARTPWDGARAVIGLLAVPALAALLRYGAGLSATVAITVGCATIALGALGFAHRAAPATAVSHAETQVRAAWRQATAEMALFLAAGLVIGVMREPVIAARAAELAGLVPAGAPGVLCLLLVTPLAGAAGIHPMAVFAVLGPSVSAVQLGISDTGLYATWIIGVGLSMLVSPASILTLTAATAFGLPRECVGARANAVFGACFAVVSAITISLFGV